MGAVENFDAPAAGNPFDADLDSIRDNYNWLLMQAVDSAGVMSGWSITGAKQWIVIPGWNTTVDISANNTYARPDAYVLTRGTRVITFNYTWEYGTAKYLVTQIDMCYDDGVSGEVCLAAVGLTYNAADEFTGNLPPYDPQSMNFADPGYYRNLSVSSAGADWTMMGLFRTSDTGHQTIMSLNTSVGIARCDATIVAFDDATASRQNKLHLSSNPGGCNLYSFNDVNDGVWHSFFATYDGSAGTLIFEIDGVDADDTGHPWRVAPTAGTPPTGTRMHVGIDNNTLTNFVGDLAYLGYDNTVQTATDFFDGTGWAIELDESTWTEWGAQPDLWAANGKLDANAGTFANLTKTGTITGPTNIF